MKKLIFNINVDGMTSEYIDKYIAYLKSEYDTDENQNIYLPVMNKPTKVELITNETDIVDNRIVFYLGSRGNLKLNHQKQQIEDIKEFYNTEDIKNIYLYTEFDDAKVEMLATKYEVSNDIVNPIICYYINVGNLSRAQAQEIMYNFMKDISSDDHDIIRYFIPIQNTDSYVKCLNYKLISEDNFKEIDDIIEKDKEKIKDINPL